jgi:thioester reductase-like protein
VRVRGAGCTGFLGVVLLKELLHALPTARIHCLIRARDGRDALARIRFRFRAFVFAFFFVFVLCFCCTRGILTIHRLAHRRSMEEAKLPLTREDEERIVLELGDLGQPNLGLSAASFAELSHVIEVVYHCGALVSGWFHFISFRFVLCSFC